MKDVSEGSLLGRRQVNTYVQTASVLLTCVASCLLHFLQGRCRGSDPRWSLVTIASFFFTRIKILSTVKVKVLAVSSIHLSMQYRIPLGSGVKDES